MSQLSDKRENVPTYSPAKATLRRWDTADENTQPEHPAAPRVPERHAGPEVPPEAPDRLVPARLEVIERRCAQITGIDHEDPGVCESTLRRFHRFWQFHAEEPGSI